MAHTFHNVDGCKLKIPELCSLATFSTHTDALFASLVLKYGESLDLALFSLLDDFLLFVRAEGFCADQLTIRKSFDVIDTIAEQRRMAAEERNAKNTLVSHNQAGLNLVGELVAEHIAEAVSLVSCHPNCERELRDSFIAQATLRTLSLVHPAWTNAAQRQLRRSVIVKGASHLFPTLLSPQLGPWVNELAFIDRGKSYEAKHVRAFDSILKKCPNIERLVLRRNEEDVEHSPPCLYRAFLLQVKELKYLQWLAFDDVYCMSVWELCSILPHLRFLQRLRLCDWYYQRIDDQSYAYLKGQKPSPTLQSLTLFGMRCGAGPLTWLLEPLGSYKPVSLETDVDVITLIPDHNPSIVAAITRLQINDVYDIGNIHRSNIERFRSVQSLILCCNSRSCQVVSDLHHLSFIRSFHLHMNVSSATNIDRCRYHVTNSSPSFRRLLITYKHNASMQTDREALVEACAAVAQACAEKNIEFDYKYSPHYPSFSDEI